MKALKSGNAQTTLSRRQQEQQAKIKKVAVAILIQVLIFLALLMLESNLISDEVYTYVVTANTDITSGTAITEQNYQTLFGATAISSRSSDEYNKITLDPSIPNFGSAEEAMNSVKNVIKANSYTSKDLSKMQYVNASEDLTTYQQYVQSSTTTTYYASSLNDKSSYHTVKVVDPVDMAFNGGDTIRASAGQIREGDIVEIGFTQTGSDGSVEYMNGWSKDYDEPVRITHLYNDEFPRKEGYYTIYTYGVRAVAGGNITDPVTGIPLKAVESKNLQRATLYVSDAEDTGAVLMKVIDDKDYDAAKNANVMAYEKYFGTYNSGLYILTTNGWEPYNANTDYSARQVSPADYDVGSHIMDMSAVHFSAVMTGPGSTIGENVEDTETTTPSVYKVIISKADIQYFYKYIGNGGLIMTKIMNPETDSHLVQPDLDTEDSIVESKYVTINSITINKGDATVTVQEDTTDTETGTDADATAGTSTGDGTLAGIIGQVENTESLKAAEEAADAEAAAAESEATEAGAESEATEAEAESEATSAVEQ